MRLGLAWAATEARGRSIDGRRLPGMQDANVHVRRQAPGVRGESIAGLHERLAPQPVELAGIERAPVDRDDDRGPDIAGHLRGGPGAEVARPEMGTPRPHGQEREIHAPCELRHRGVAAGVAREVDPRRGPPHVARAASAGDGARAGARTPEHVAERLRPRRARSDPVARRDSVDREARHDDGLARADLNDLRAGAPARKPKPPRGHDHRPPGQPLDRRRIEVVRVAVRDQDDVRLQLGGVGERAVPLEWPEPRAEERVRQDADAVDLDEGRRVADESNGDRGARGFVRLSPSRRRSGRPRDRERGAAWSGGEGA
jgi:hypothetical protein